MISALSHTTSTMRGLLARTRVALLHLTQYRAEMAIWTTTNMLQIIVYLSVWRAVAQSRGGSTGGYTASEFAGYFLVLLIVRESTMTFIPFTFARHVRLGTLAPLLLRPLHPLADPLAEVLAFRVQSVLTMLPIAALLFLAFNAHVDASINSVLALAIVLPLAALVRILLDCLLALTSLWMTRIDGIRGIYFTFVLLLGGQFAPLGVLPHSLQTVAKLLPFYWTLGYPTELAIGVAPVSDVWIGLLVLGGWAVAAFALIQPIWRAGTRAYEAVGT